MNLSIVIPSYEEGENLKILLPQIVRVCRGLGISFEIFIVDTQIPRDQTPNICRSYGEIVYLNREGSDQYGDAIRTGIHRSKGHHVLIMDADGSHDPDFLSKLWDEREKADVVIASRYVRGGHTHNTLTLRCLSKILNLTYRFFLGIPCADISNSFKLYRGEWLRSLNLFCDHFDIVEEILTKLIVQYPKLIILEIPSFFRRRNKGVTKRNLFAFIFSYLKTIKKLRQFKRQELLKVSKQGV